MHHGDGPMAVAMRVGILLGGRAVRGPSGVSDAVSAVYRAQTDPFFQVPQLSRGAPHLKGFVLHNGEARRVITAILQSPQPFEQHGDDALVPDVTDNS